MAITMCYKICGIVYILQNFFFSSKFAVKQSIISKYNIIVSLNWQRTCFLVLVQEMLNHKVQKSFIEKTSALKSGIKNNFCLFNCVTRCQLTVFCRTGFCATGFLQLLYNFLTYSIYTEPTKIHYPTNNIKITMINNSFDTHTFSNENS